MVGFISWVDYSSLERQRMRQAVALFEEKDTRDELGIGTIRDAFADELFPGTSVVQTRLRYALFIPWVYARLEQDSRATCANIERRTRDAELDLIEPLLASSDTIGVIGSRAKRSIERLPSSVYWLALQRWGIFRRSCTMDQYFRGWDGVRRERASLRRTDDAGVLPSAIWTWHPALPPPPADFPAAATFELSAEEADFLRGRLVEACQGSLLARAATHAGACRNLNAESPWEAFDDLPSPLERTLVLARRFAFLVRGAALAYNLALARSSPGWEALGARLEAELAVWADVARSMEVAEHGLEELWGFCGGVRANVSARTREFLESWRRLLAEQGYEQAPLSAEALALVEQRERLLKGARSRFGNTRALETWGGQAGTALLTYRWPTVQRFLSDLYRGLERGEG